MYELYLKWGRVEGHMCMVILFALLLKNTVTYATQVIYLALYVIGIACVARLYYIVKHYQQLPQRIREELTLSSSSFDFWINDEDSVYDDV